MYCPKCGNKNLDDACFCEYCGEDLRKLSKNKDSYINPIYTNDQVGRIDDQVDRAYDEEDGRYNKEEYYQEPAYQDNYEEEAYQEGFSQWTKPEGDQSYQDMNLQVKKSSFPLLGISLIFEVLVLIALLAFFFIKLPKFKTPEQAAEKAFVALVNGDIEEANKMILKKDSPFTKVDKMKEASKSWAFEQVTAYHIEMGENDGEGQEKKILINATMGADGSKTTEQMPMLKDSNAFILDNPWKLDASFLMAEEVEILVPSTTVVKLDGVDLTPYRSRPDGEYDRYVIPQLFFGVHTLTYQDQRGESHSLNYYVCSENKTIRLNNEGNFSAEEKNLFLNMVGSNLRRISDALINGDEFYNIKDIFATENINNIEAEYNKQLEAYMNQDPYKSFEVRSIKANIDPVTYKVNLSINYNVSRYVFTRGQAINWKERSGNEDLSIQFVKEKGNWKQAELGLLLTPGL